MRTCAWRWHIRLHLLLRSLANVECGTTFWPAMLVGMTRTSQGAKLSLLSVPTGGAGEPAEPELVDRGPPPGVPPREMPCTAVDGTEAATHLEVRPADFHTEVPLLSG